MASVHSSKRGVVVVMLVAMAAASLAIAALGVSKGSSGTVAAGAVASP